MQQSLPGSAPGSIALAKGPVANGGAAARGEPRPGHHATGTQLHLAGLVTRVVARALQVTDLLECFDTYLTLTDALPVLTN